MSQIAIQSARQNIRVHSWMPVLACIGILMAATVSPPEDFKVDSYGTTSILPPAILKLGKGIARVLSLVLICYSLYIAWFESQRWKSASLLLPIFAFTILAVGSAAWSSQKMVTISQSGSFVTLIGLAWLIATCWKSEKDTCRLLRWCTWLLMLISISLVALHFLFPRLGVLTRSSSGIFHSTNAGATASLGIVIIFAARMTWGWRWTGQLLLPATAAHLASMVIGQNRLSFAVMVLVCVLYFLVMADKAHVSLVGLTLGSAATFYICLDPGLVLATEVLDEFIQFGAQGQNLFEIQSLSGRSEMWSKIWDSYLESPLVGHGYFVTSKEGRLFVWGEWGNWTAHNFGLQLLATSGALGAVLLIGGLTNIALRVLNIIGSSDRNRNNTAVFLLMMGIWFFCWGTLNESFLGPLQPESVIFAVVLGLSTALVMAHRTRTIDINYAASGMITSNSEGKS